MREVSELAALLAPRALRSPDRHNDSYLVLVTGTWLQVAKRTMVGRRGSPKDRAKPICPGTGAGLFGIPGCLQPDVPAVYLS